MEPIISTDSLTKRYGQKVVVDALHLDVPAGAVYGFIGPNGSGKSTTMKMLLGLVTPSAGKVHVLGTPVTASTRGSLLPHIGSLIESPPGYGHLTGGENMEIVRSMLRLPAEAVDDAVRAVRLEKQMDKLVKNYSLGMKQRLGIAMALARRPELLVLDEPTNGLDPSGIEEIRELLRRLTLDGRTVMISSHQLDEVDRMASHLGIIDGGRLLFQGSRSELDSKSAPDVTIRTPDRLTALAVTTVAGMDASESASEVRVRGLDDEGVNHLVYALVERGVKIHEVVRNARSLEDIFIDLTGRGGAL